MADAYATCSVDGCGLRAKRVGLGLCEKHYMRLYRNGTTDYVGQRIHGNLVHSGGYILIPAPGHPRALGAYRAYEHRVVFFDRHGDGPFNCHWCGCVVTWRDMHVDHVDGKQDNNSPGNLVASCPSCNEGRARDRLRQTMRARHGLTIAGKTLTLNEWAAEVGISRRSIVSRMKRGWSPDRAVLEPRGKFGPKSNRAM